MKEYKVKICNGLTQWFNLNDQLHREDGPAIEGVNGSKEWYINGQKHREDGPAIEFSSGYKAWYLKGQRLTESEFNARMNPIELTMDQIAALAGVDVSRLKIKK